MSNLNYTSLSHLILTCTKELDCNRRIVSSESGLLDRSISVRHGRENNSLGNDSKLLLLAFRILRLFNSVMEGGKTFKLLWLISQTSKFAEIFGRRNIISKRHTHGPMTYSQNKFLHSKSSLLRNINDLTNLPPASFKLCAIITANNAKSYRWNQQVISCCMVLNSSLIYATFNFYTSMEYILGRCLCYNSKNNKKNKNSYY